MAEDEELKRIKLKRLREMFRRRALKESLESTKKQEETVPSSPVDLTDMTFKEAVQSHPLVVVDCWAPWCGPCRLISPILEEIARDYAGKIFFGKLNVDENPKVATQYGIMSIPTLLIFKNSRLVDRVIGAMPRKILESRITRYL